MDYLKLTDLLTGKNISGYYREYCNTQWYSKEQMIDYQLRKLRSLISHCFVNVPYYTRIMNEGGINPNAVKSLDYLKQFPVLTKELIKKHYVDFIPLNEQRLRGIRSSQTGGTTGNILNKRNDAYESIKGLSYAR